jgi:chromate transporter
MDGPAAASPATVSTPGLFVGFLKIGLSGFGGVPLARHMIVQRRWLSELEFLDVLSLLQSLPGPLLALGTRLHSPWLLGIAAFLGACGSV